MMTNTAQPVRTCIATRRTAPSQELLRLVAQVNDHGVVVILPDPCRKMQGRGAWIEPKVEAWELACRRRAFARAFHISGSVIDAKPVRDYIIHKTKS